MKQLFIASIITMNILACGETPGTGTDSPASTTAPSEKNSGVTTTDTASGSGREDSSQIRVMSADSSQLNASSDSARASQKSTSPGTR